jgi:hypothetical protein
MKTSLTRLAGAFALSVLFSISAHALSFNLSVPNAAMLPYPPDYATVNITVIDGTHADVTFTALSNYRFGGAQAIDLNVVGSFTVSAPSNMTSPTIGSGHADGFGLFSLTIDNFDGWGKSFTTTSFSLLGVGTSWTDGSILTANSNGTFAAAHIFVPNANNDGAVATGFVGNGGSHSAPDGGTTAVLLGVGLLGLSFLARRRMVA